MREFIEILRDPPNLFLDVRPPLPQNHRRDAFCRVRVRRRPAIPLKRVRHPFTSFFPARPDASDFRDLRRKERAADLWKRFSLSKRGVRTVLVSQLDLSTPDRESDLFFHLAEMFAPGLTLKIETLMVLLRRRLRPDGATAGEVQLLRLNLGAALQTLLLRGMIRRVGTGYRSMAAATTPCRSAKLIQNCKNFLTVLHRPGMSTISYTEFQYAFYGLLSLQKREVRGQLRAMGGERGVGIDLLLGNFNSDHVYSAALQVAYIDGSDDFDQFSLSCIQCFLRTIIGEAAEAWLNNAFQQVHADGVTSCTTAHDGFSLRLLQQKPYQMFLITATDESMAG